MINNFSKQLEVFDGFETENIKLLYYDLACGYEGTYKTYEYTRLCTILEGEKNVRVNNNKEFSYSTNEFIVLPPNSQVEMKMNTHTKALVLEMSDDLLSNVSKNVISDYCDSATVSKQNDVFCGSKRNAIEYELNSIFTMYLSPKKEREKIFLIDLAAQKMAYELLKEREIRPLINGDTDRPVSKSIKYIKDNVYNNITIEELAFLSNMSVSHYSKHFKRVVGVCPNTYIRNIKLKKAKELLTYKSVTEVAYDLSYSNVSYFIRLFKEKYGVTPKRWQSMEKIIL